MTRLKQGTPAGLAIGFICMYSVKKKICSASVGFDPITLTVCRHDTYLIPQVRIDSTSRITSIQYGVHSGYR